MSLICKILPYIYYEYDQSSYQRIREPSTPRVMRELPASEAYPGRMSTNIQRPGPPASSPYSPRGLVKPFHHTWTGS